MKEVVPRFCPKCSNLMEEVKPARNPPCHVIPRGDAAPYRSKVISTGVYGGVPVELYVCPKCRYVEIYALGREGAEALLE